MNKVENCLVVFRELREFINSKPGLEFANYGDRSSYRAELRQIAKDKERALNALREAETSLIIEGECYGNYPDLLSESLTQAFSGRLSWNEEKQRLEYCTGQYRPTEYRKAAASVLEKYCSLRSRRVAEMKPRAFKYKTLSDVKIANKEIGNHWFSKGAMLFFGTRIHGGLIGGKYFVTSEQPPHGTRKYSVRVARPDGTIDTLGEFCSHMSLESARQAIQNQQLRDKLKA